MYVLVWVDIHRHMRATKSWTGWFESTGPHTLSYTHTHTHHNPNAQPETLGKLNELEELVLSSNRLEGVIPDLERCQKLQTLDLQGNCLETGACVRSCVLA
jgi:hypothetical protein